EHEMRSRSGLHVMSHWNRKRLDILPSHGQLDLETCHAVGSPRDDPGLSSGVLDVDSAHGPLARLQRAGNFSGYKGRVQRLRRRMLGWRGRRYRQDSLLPQRLHLRVYLDQARGDVDPIRARAGDVATGATRGSFPRMNVEVPEVIHSFERLGGIVRDVGVPEQPRNRQVLAAEGVADAATAADLS